MAVDPVSLAITAAMMAAQMAMTASQHFEGPRLESTDVSGADYGTPWPHVLGCRRLEGVPIGWAEKLREKKVTTKTKGGKFANYKYWGTWLVFLTHHEIDGVRRIWLDKHLVYQAADAGPQSPILGLVEGPFGIEMKLEAGQNLRIYKGTEDQLPDPRYEAWCDDKGVGAPAYRGRSYIVFEEIPLEKFGNRIPQITVEVVSSKNDGHPFETFTTNQAAGSGFVFGGDWAVVPTSYGVLEWWDVATRSNMGFSSEPFLFAGSVPNVALARNGTAYFMGAGTEYFGGPGVPFFVTCPPLGTAARTLSDAASPLFEITRVIGDSTALTAYFTSTPGYVLGPVHQAHTQVARDFAPDEDGVAWALLQPVGASDDFTLENLEDGTSVTFNGAVVRSGISRARLIFYDGKAFVHGGDGHFYIVDKDTGAVDLTGVPAWAGLPVFRQRGEATFWEGFSEYSLSDGSLVRSVDPNDWSSPFNYSTAAYDPLNNAIWTRGAGGLTASVPVLYLDRLSNAGVTLRDVVEYVAELAGVTNVDADDLDQVVRGYSFTQGTGRQILDPLLALHDSDARPHGFIVEFLKRRGIAAGATMATADFVRERGDGAPYDVRIAPDEDLPWQVTVNFADEGKDQQTNNVVSLRPQNTNGSDRTSTIDMTTYVSSPPEMQKFDDRYLRRLWNSRLTVRNALTRAEVALEPADVRVLELDGITRGLRCTRAIWSRGTIRAEWVHDAPTLAGLSSGTGAPMDGRDDEQIYVAGPTKAVVLDMPLVSDAHEVTNVPQVYYSAGRYLDSAAWPGASFWRADPDGDEFSPWNDVDTSQGMAWGIVQTALDDVPNPWAWDRGNTLTVAMRSGALTAVTEDDIDADPSLNLALLWNQATGAVELFNFTSVTLVSTGTYDLSGFKRGRRGTEWTCGTHGSGEVFVLVEDLLRDSLALSDVGTAETFKAMSFGRDLAGAQEIDLATFGGGTLKPYSPVDLVATLDAATGDWLFTWTRRTRIGGAWVGGTTIPLGENSEAYELVIPTSGGGERVISTSSVSATWTAAEQTADYGAPQTDLPDDIVAYQLSDAVGRGFASDMALAA